MSENPNPDVCLKMRCQEPRADVWQRMLGPRGLCARGSLADQRAGDPFEIETAAGDFFTGTVSAWEPGVELGLTIGNMYDSVLELRLEAFDDAEAPTGLQLSLVAVELHHDEIQSFLLRWRLQLGDLFVGTVDPGVDWLS